MTDQPAAAPTPGPWEWDAGDIGQDYPASYCDVFVDGGNLIIAQVNDRFSREIGHANARLIAAAPDTAAERDRLKVKNEGLVKALESVEGQFDSTAHRYGCECGGSNPPHDSCAETRRKVLAALAEARK